jgi:hypothetical protein
MVAARPVSCRHPPAFAVALAQRHAVGAVDDLADDRHAQIAEALAAESPEISCAAGSAPGQGMARSCSGAAGRARRRLTSGSRMAAMPHRRWAWLASRLAPTRRVVPVVLIRVNECRSLDHQDSALLLRTVSRLSEDEMARLDRLASMRHVLADMGLLGAFLAEGHLPCHGNRAVWGDVAVPSAAPTTFSGLGCDRRSLPRSWSVMMKPTRGYSTFRPEFQPPWSSCKPFSLASSLPSWSSTSWDGHRSSHVDVDVDYVASAPQPVGETADLLDLVGQRLSNSDLLDRVDDRGRAGRADSGLRH